MREVSFSENCSTCSHLVIEEIPSYFMLFTPGSLLRKYCSTLREKERNEMGWFCLITCGEATGQGIVRVGLVVLLLLSDWIKFFRSG